MADQVAARATARLTILAAETFAPAARPTTTDADAVGVLVQARREAARCRCRATLPASAFFRLDATTGALDAATLTGPVAAPPELEELARADAHRARDPFGPTVHLVADPRLGDDVLVTLVRYDETGAATSVTGLVADARETVRALFGRELLRPAVIDSAGALAALDSASVRVVAEAGPPLLGRLGAGRPLRATVHPRGALDALTIDVALRVDDVTPPLRPSLAGRGFRVPGALALATVAVTLIAAGTRRRGVRV